jgi:hypothetical protein
VDPWDDVIGSVVVTAAMLVQNILVAAFRQAYCRPC